LSRADRDEEAIVAYDKVAARYPGSPWGAKAAFFAPYLRMLHGDWTVCARGFARVTSAKTPAEQAEDARRDGALCAMMSGDVKAARRAFEHLADDEHDAVSHGRMANMAALAALRDDDRTHAVARWTDVAQTCPLTWPAMVARAHLVEVGAPVPPEIDDDSATGPDPAPLVVRLPPPADVVHAIGLDTDAESILREREGVLTVGESRASELLCRTYGELGRARRRYQISQSLSPSLFATKPGPRTRWAWECAFPTPYENDVRAAEARENLPVGLLWAVMRQESGFDPEAVSPAHAVGLMQLMPEVASPIADELGLPADETKLKSPPVAVPLAAHLLGKLVSRFQGQVPLAVAAYNAGADAVARWLSRAPGLDLDTFVERIPYAETRQYVVKVMGNWARYGYLGGGEALVPRVVLGIEGLKRP
jgi:soluble lytic murein transglycosylase